MRRIERYFVEYAAAHQTRGNKICHSFGIPMILLSALGLLALVDLPGGLDLGLLAVLLATIYYMTLDLRLAAVALMVLALFYGAGSLLPWQALVGLWVVGWALQYIGHGVYEHRRPAFFRNLQHLLIGPAWMLNNAVPMIGKAETGEPAGGE